MTRKPDENDEENSETYRSWSHDIQSLQEVGKDILTEWNDQNPNSPRDYPSAQWLRENGYSHLRWILSKKHDMGLSEFFILLTSAGGSTDYEWDIDDLATLERAKTYLEDQVECRDWALTTRRTHRYRLNEVLRQFNEKYGDDRLIILANDPSQATEVYEAFKQVGKILREELDSDDSAYQYVRSAHRFFEWLKRSGRIEYDPMKGIEEEFNWDLGGDATALTDEQVRRLWTAAETEEERMLVIGYCIWGLRTQELPAVNVDQIYLTKSDPRIVFKEDDRKNGPGKVSLIFGLDPLADILDKHAQQSGWNGYLFPSDTRGRSFLCAKQVRLRFKKLSQKAGVRVDGEPATPKHGRAFYYNILADAEDHLIEIAAEIAKEQGSTDAEAVLEYYLTEERRRQIRRTFFRDRIRQILPEEAYARTNSQENTDSTIDDFN